MNRDDVIKFIDGKVFYYSDYINFLYKQLELKDNIIKEIRETLNNKRDIVTTHFLNGSYCDYEELLYQVDEEIRKILDKDNK